MNYIPMRNCSIKIPTGLSFRSFYLPSLLTPKDLVIAPPIIANVYPDEITPVSPYQLHKVTNDKSYSRLILDLKLPRQGSRMLDELKRLSKGKLVVFIEDLTDWKQVSSAVALIAETRKPSFYYYEFNTYMYTRGSFRMGR